MKNRPSAPAWILVAAGCLAAVSVSSCTASGGVRVVQAGNAAPSPSLTASPEKSLPPTTPPTTARAQITASGQTLTINPSNRLVDGQTVDVVATGFTPGEGNVGIAECLSKGTGTGPRDCNIPGIKNVTPDQTGTVTASFVVKKGPFGSNSVVCSGAQPCLIAVTQLVYTPTQVATTEITFAP